MKASLQDLISQLEALSPSTTAEQALALLHQPKTAVLEEARRRVALVRSINGEVYRFLADGLENAPEVDGLIAAYAQDFQRVPPQDWEMNPPVRDYLLAAWRANETDWRAWNTRLFRHYFQPKKTRASQLEAVYHSAGSSDPKEGIPYFQECYKEADDRADFAHCHALLEAVRSQEASRGSDFSRAYRDRARYLQSRLFFLNSLQKTGSYLYRPVPHQKAESIISRTADDPWIFHIHATGGVGKTMLLRWLVSRDLVLRRIPCAYADFDDPDMRDVVTYPLRLLGTILQQWAQQMTESVFSSAVELLDNARSRPGWDESVLAEFRPLMEGARSHLQGPMIIILDTLEDVTLANVEWLTKCVATLRELHKYIPRLTLLLSGRYNLEKRGSVLVANDAVVYELPHFSRTEAVDYLLLRKIRDAAMQSAIIERTVVRELKDGKLVEIGYNPFKLALMAELVLDREDLKPEDVSKLPSVDIAYLIERVIVRIQSQALRWMIRYAAIARRFTKAFLEQVLLPPLRDALRGDSNDLSKTHLGEEVRKYLDSKVTWEPEPKLADSLNAGDLWDQLGEYARERGWISIAPGQGILQLHPEVVQPVRLLLSEEPVNRILHEAARDYYLKTWDARPDPSGADAFLDGADAVYHAAQLDVQEAILLWKRLVEQASGDAAYQIAKEPTGPDYLLSGEERQPRYPEWFCEAHIRCAELKMKEAGVYFCNQHDNWPVFSAHVAAARRVNAGMVPPLFDTSVRAANPPADGGKAEAIENALPAFSRPYDRLWLHLQAALYFDYASLNARAEAHWLRAADLVDSAGSGIPRWQVDLMLARFYRSQDRYSAALAAYQRVSEGSGPATAAQTWIDRANLAFNHHDLRRAVEFSTGLRKFEAGPFAPALLALRQNIATGNLGNALPDIGSVRTLARSDEDRALLDALTGEIHGYLMDFRNATESLARATDTYTSIRDNARAAAGRIREIEFCVYGMGAYEQTAQFLEKWESLPGIQTADFRTRLEIVRAFLAIQRGDRSLAEHVIGRLFVSPQGISLRYWCKFALFGLAFDLTRDAAQFRDLPSWFQALDPPEICAEIFDFLEYCPSPSQSLADAGRSISRWILDALDWSYEVPPELPVQLVDLARLSLASSGEIAERLQWAYRLLPPENSGARVWHGLRLLEAYERCGMEAPFRYSDLLAQAQVPWLQGTPLEALLKAKTAGEVSHAGDLDQAVRLANDAKQVWDKQPPNRRLTEVAGVDAELTGRYLFRVDEVALHDSSHPSPAKPIAVRVEPDLQIIWVAGVSHLLKDLESGTIDVSMRLLNDWEAVRETLRSALLEAGTSSGAEVQVVTSLGQAALPWEFAASALQTPFMCRGVERSPGGPRQGQTLSRRVLVVKPTASDDAHTAFSQSVGEGDPAGFAIEWLYASGQQRGYVTAIEEPQPDEFRSILERVRPAIIHLAGQLIETPTGVYLDFEGSERRLYKGARQHRQEARLDANRLLRYLDKQCPFVILDIKAPENITDAVRMLLLRNRFAAELFQSGQVTGVLATGLAPAYEREQMTRTTVDCIHGDQQISQLWKSLRRADEARLLADALAYHSTALFAYDPHQPVFADASGDWNPER